MVFYFDFICVNLPLSAFICVLYFQSNRPERQFADTDENISRPRWRGKPST